MGKRGTTGNQGVKEALFGYRHQQGAFGKQGKIGKHELSFRTILWELSIHSGGGLFSAKVPKLYSSVYIVVVDCSQQRFPNYTIVGTQYSGGLFSAKVPKYTIDSYLHFIARACDAVSFSNNILYTV